MKNSKLTKQQVKEMSAVAALQDSEIDYSDIPATEETDWKRAVAGKFYRPVKHSTTVRIDGDVLAWLKAQGRGYQTRINAVLRAYMESQRRVKAPR